MTETNQVINAIYYCHTELSPYFFEEDPTKKQQIKDNLMGNIIPYYMTKFENLASNNGGYLHGHQVLLLALFLFNYLYKMYTGGNS